MHLNLMRCIETQIDNNDFLTVSTERKDWSKGSLIELSFPENDGAIFPDQRYISATERKLSRAGNGELTYQINWSGVFLGKSAYRSYQEHEVYFSWDAEKKELKIFENKEEAMAAIGLNPEVIAERKKEFENKTKEFSQKIVNEAIKMYGDAVKQHPALQESKASFWIDHRFVKADFVL